ncbi:hypothetical protein KA529_04100 [Candidatus Saccharibacteria bacterium]|nr:hypothetical protein [Candidatus Saccharibacteria bacterium]
MVKNRVKKNKSRKPPTIISISFIVALIVFTVIGITIYVVKATAYSKCIKDGGQAVTIFTNPGKHLCTTKDGKTYTK